MPTSKLQIAHQLGTAEARQRISKFAEATRQRPGPLISDIQDSWADDSGTFSFRVLGLTISGRVKVENNQVQIDIDYPMAALAFKGHIEQDIRAKGEALLAGA